MLGLIGIAAAVLLVARRAQAASSRRPELEVVPQPELGPLEVTAPVFVAPTVARILPLEPSPLERVAAGLGEVVDQVKDALKGLGLWSHKVPEKYRELFAMAGATYRLPPGLLEAVAYRESRFRDDIIDGRVRSSAGALGIMQIVPRWHPELGEAGALDVGRAVPYAARYLRSLFERFGTWRYALAAYNWGPTALAKAISAGTPNRWPSETVAYVAEISGNAGLA